MLLALLQVTGTASGYWHYFRLTALLQVTGTASPDLHFRCTVLLIKLFDSKNTARCIGLQYIILIHILLQIMPKGHVVLTAIILLFLSSFGKWKSYHLLLLALTETNTGTTQKSPFGVILLKPPFHVMHQQFNIQQLYVLPTLYLCVLCLSENKQRLVPLTA